MVDAGQQADALASYQSDGTKLEQGVWTAVDEFSKKKSEVGLALREEGQGTYALLWKVASALAILAVAAAVGAGLVLSRSITRGVRDVQVAVRSLAEHCAASLENGLRAIAANDLTVAATTATAPIRSYGRDEIGQTAALTNTLVGRMVNATQSYEQARANLQALVGEIQVAADGVAGSSQSLGSAADGAGDSVQQVSGTVQQVAGAVRDQAGVARETARSVEQLLEAIDQVARGAQEQAESIVGLTATADAMAAGVSQVAANIDAVATAGDRARTSAEAGAASGPAHHQRYESDPGDGVRRVGSGQRA